MAPFVSLHQLGDIQSFVICEDVPNADGRAEAASSTVVDYAGFVDHAVWEDFENVFALSPKAATTPKAKKAPLRELQRTEFKEAVVWTPTAKTPTKRPHTWQCPSLSPLEPSTDCHAIDDGVSTRSGADASLLDEPLWLRRGAAWTQYEEYPIDIKNTFIDIWSPIPPSTVTPWTEPKDFKFASQREDDADVIGVLFPSSPSIDAPSSPSICDGPPMTPELSREMPRTPSTAGNVFGTVPLPMRVPAWTSCTPARSDILGAAPFHQVPRLPCSWGEGGFGNVGGRSGSNAGGTMAVAQAAPETAYIRPLKLASCLPNIDEPSPGTADGTAGSVLLLANHLPASAMPGAVRVSLSSALGL